MIENNVFIEFFVAGLMLKDTVISMIKDSSLFNAVKEPMNLVFVSIVTGFQQMRHLRFQVSFVLQRARERLVRSLQFF